MALFFVNGWLFVELGDGTGVVYDTSPGQTTLAIASHWGRGERFPDLDSALGYFRGIKPE